MVVTDYFDFDAQTPSLCERQFQFNAYNYKRKQTCGEIISI
jgi:hypothetical protein